MNQTNDALIDDESEPDEQVRSAGGTVVSLHIAPSADVLMTALRFQFSTHGSEITSLYGMPIVTCREQERLIAEGQQRSDLIYSEQVI